MSYGYSYENFWLDIYDISLIHIKYLTLLLSQKNIIIL